MKMIRNAVYGKDNDELMCNALGLNHDRCYHLYRGKMEKLPEEYNEYKTNDNYILVYEEPKLEE